MKKILHHSQILLFLVSGFLLTGCSTVVNSHRQKESMMKDYMLGREANVVNKIAGKLSSTKGTGDEMLWNLEAGTMNFIIGDYSAAIEHLNRAEALIKEYDDRAFLSLRDMGSEGAMAVTNLNALPYRGFCRDRIMIPVFLALSYLGNHDEEGFRVELFRLRQAQQKVMDDYRKFFEEEGKAIDKKKEEDSNVAAALSDKAEMTDNSAFNKELTYVYEVANKGYGNFLNPLAIFLSGIGFIRDGDYENAYIDFNRLYEALPNNLRIQQYYKMILEKTGRDAPDALSDIPAYEHPMDRDSVYVIFANGRSVAFKQIAVYFPVMTAWPICEYYSAPYSALSVTADGETVDTVTIADMDGILSQEYKERLPAMIARITVSTLLKEGASYGAAYAAWRENPAVGIAVLLTSVVYRATFNTADTRSWEILPKEFQIAHLPMPADRKIKLSAKGGAPYEFTTELPERCKSAIIYVHAPSFNVFDYKILRMETK